MQLPPVWIAVGLALFRYHAAAQPEQGRLLQNSDNEVKTHRIAIIGAGAAGSSAAYYLSRFAKSSNLDLGINVTIFETNNRIGGRTTTVNALNDPRYPAELGASIFVEVNKILINNSRDFDLDFKQKLYESTGSNFDLGIWNGHSFVFKITSDDDNDGSWKGRWRGWWDVAKLLWKYGLSPIRTQRLAKDAVGRFLKLYDDYFPFSDLTTAVEEVELIEFTGLTGEELLASSGISEQFGREIIQSSTRVNYAQNLGSIHGLETMVCMSINGATAVEGGNWQIFDRMVRKSGANVNFNSTVTGIETTADGKFRLKIKEASSLSVEEFDSVILAAPFQDSNVTFEPGLIWKPETVDYVDLHVTLFTSPFRPSPEYFGVESQDEVPDSILTALPEGMNMGDRRGQHAVGPTKFWSLSTLRILNPSSDDYIGAQAAEKHIDLEIASLGRQYLYKIFSPKPVSPALLSDIFGWSGSYSGDDNIGSLPKELITWHYEKKWHSYPYLPPRTEFGCYHLWQHDGKDSSLPDRRSNIWYTSIIEPFISTMETSALSGMNVAKLIVNQLDPNVQTESYPCMNRWKKAKPEGLKKEKVQITEL